MQRKGEESLMKDSVNKDLLLIIDMQNVYKTGEEWGCCHVSEASEAIRRLLDSGVFRDVAFTRFLAADAPRGAWKDYNSVNAAINADERLNDMMEEFKPYLSSYPLLTKSVYSSFDIPELRRLSEKAEHVVITGVVAECCVLSSVLSAIDLGYPVIFIKDGVSGLSPESEAETEKIVSYFAPVHTTVMTADEYIKMKMQSL